MMDEQATLIRLTQELLESIVDGNWQRYTELCDPSLTCFEPEALGHLVEGMEFHQFYFKMKGPEGGPRANTTISRPHVRIMGETAIVSYVRLMQQLDGSGSPESTAFEETRVWHKLAGQWLHVHFHRS